MAAFRGGQNASRFATVTTREFAGACDTRHDLIKAHRIPCVIGD